MVTKQEYHRIYNEEMAVAYPTIDAFEELLGYSIPHVFLAKVAWLACPLKQNPPNWQHGRVIYAVLRNYLCNLPLGESYRCVDIGTAKGFSALCAAKALWDAQRPGHIHSIDVIDPNAKTTRNSISDCDGPTTLYELLAPFRGLISDRVSFHHNTGAVFLKDFEVRVNFAFVDGKHRYDQVNAELKLLASRQEKGDVIVADDIQIEGVGRAVGERAEYDREFIDALPGRRYAIMRRK